MDEFILKGFIKRSKECGLSKEESQLITKKAFNLQQAMQRIPQLIDKHVVSPVKGIPGNVQSGMGWNNKIKQMEQQITSDPALAEEYKNKLMLARQRRMASLMQAGKGAGIAGGIGGAGLLGARALMGSGQDQQAAPQQMFNQGQY